MSRKYRFWPQANIREAIIALEEAISSGAATVSFQGPGGGTVQWTSYENFELILRDLNDAYDRADGLTSKPALQQIRIYGRSPY
ncbi:hypothetical protein E0H39_29685 [Rhizobium leguminosarum bv. viciae]|uniref:hypothetical protein n=1 Tax=Rhizobium leguminosarum TaxID=384 RepID=UPI00103CDF96|nr:hypothetical protein [Rhizobium leguminosarum]TBY57990.1 hypothetical protein E0H39_29685 [Rhizobium leguminosarum bv. viciae]